MGDDENWADNASTQRMKPEEAIEFLKLVEQAREEGGQPQPEPVEDIPKPKKRFRLKSRGKKKAKRPGAPTAKVDEEPLKRSEPQKISNEKLMEILQGSEESSAGPAPIAPKEPGGRSASKAVPPAPKRDSRWMEGLLAIAFIAFVVKIGWPVSAPAIVNPSATPNLATAQGQSPDLVAVYFARALSLRRFSEAHGMMSAEKRASLAVSALESSILEFLSKSPDSLDRVRVGSMQRDGNTAQVFLKMGPAENTWEVTLLQQRDQWSVHAVSGDIRL